MVLRADTQVTKNVSKTCLFYGVSWNTFYEWRRSGRSDRLEPSMRRKWSCWDNAVAESFFGSPKERIKKQTCENRELAAADVADYIVAFAIPVTPPRAPRGREPRAVLSSSQIAL
jgi:transposase InsO family protein